MSPRTYLPPAPMPARLPACLTGCRQLACLLAWLCAILLSSKAGRLPTCLFAYPTALLPACLPAYLPACLSGWPAAWLLACLAACMPASLPACLRRPWINCEKGTSNLSFGLENGWNDSLYGAEQASASLQWPWASAICNNKYFSVHPCNLAV